MAIAWYHEGSLINPATDSRYSVSQEEGLYTLTVIRVVTGLLGRYVAVVTAGGRNSNDSVRLAFPGEKQCAVVARAWDIATLLHVHASFLELIVNQFLFIIQLKLHVQINQEKKQSLIISQSIQSI